MAQTNEPHLVTRYESWLLNRADARTAEALQEFQLALQAGEIELPSTLPETPLLAGGVNYCPNSDFKYSKKAIETPGTLPSDTTDPNYECYRWYRQEQGDDITESSAFALKSSSHSLYAANEGANADIPVWDRALGYLLDGSDGPDLWDVAVKLYNNDVNPSNIWYASFVLGATSADLVPADLEMYCGFWHKTASDEGWIEGGTLDLDYEVIGIKGTKDLNYMVVALTDSGVTLYSQVLNVTDAPDTFNTAVDVPANQTNFVRVRYDATQGSGFVQFKIYREDVAAGTFHQIADIRNTNNLLFDDLGARVNMTPVAALPTPVLQNTRAIAFSRRLNVGEFGGPLLLNQFTIKVPDGYNWSATLPFSQYFRFGFTRTAGVPRHIRIDQVFVGRSFNRWADSTFDPINGVIPSTSQTGGVPTGGGTGDPPPPGGGTCIRLDVPVLRIDFDRKRVWLPYKQIPQGDLLENGATERNVVRIKLPGKTRVLVFLYFSNGSWLPGNLGHRLRINEKGDCETLRHLNVGDSVWGWNSGVPGPTQIVKKVRRLYKVPQEIGTFALVGEKGNEGDHFFVAGFSDDGDSGVFNSNLKFPDGPEF